MSLLSRILEPATGKDKGTSGHLPATDNAENTELRNPVPSVEAERPILSFEERVRHRAHTLYLQRGDNSGSPLDDWLMAEKEIRLEDERQRAEL